MNLNTKDMMNKGRIVSSDVTNEGIGEVFKVSIIAFHDFPMIMK